MTLRLTAAVLACVLALTAASAVRADDDRTLWGHRFGSFQKMDGDLWLETLKGSRCRYTEKARTAEYIELFDPKGMKSVRLYKDRCEGQADPNKPEFTKLYDGGWKKLDTPADAPKGVSDDRLRWGHRFGWFEKVNDVLWVEESKNKTTVYKEIDRKDEYIELFEPKQKIAVRLYKDRCEGQTDPAKPEFTKLYDGDWRKITPGPAAGPEPKAVVDKPGEREFWEHRDFTFKKVDEFLWESTNQGRPLATLVERARTQDYVELYRSGSREFTRLYADRFERAESPENPKFSKVIDGKWATDPSKPQFTGKAEDRDYWRFPGGHFEKGRKDRWYEVHDDRKEPKEWIETSRGKDFIEMKDVAPRDQQRLIRLSADRCDLVVAGGKGRPGRLYVGLWGKGDEAVKPYAATGKPQDRDSWTRDADHHFEKVGEGKWLEVGKDKKYDWVERAVTDKSVELFDVSRGLTVRLTDSDCILIGRGTDIMFEKLFPGKWGKVVASGTKPVEQPKPAVRAKAEWVVGLDKMRFPEGEVAGMLNGVEFLPNDVRYVMSERELKFSFTSKDNKSRLPDLEIVIDVANSGNAKPPLVPFAVPDGVTLKKKFKDFKDPGYIVRVVAQDRTSNNKTETGVLSVGDTAYVIEYTGQKGDKLAGKIYLCLDDGKKSFLAGSFEATIEK